MLISQISIATALISATIIAIDLKHNPQKMRVMNIIWILSSLWSSIFALVAYFTIGRETKAREITPRWQKVILSTFHCGAGCTLADTLGALFLIIVPIPIVVSSLGGRWTFNYLLSLCFGIIFQYNTIKFGSALSNREVLRRAIIVNIASLTIWKSGVYTWLYLVIYKLHFIKSYSIPTWDFWFGLQQAMCMGFLVALPVNYLLIRLKIK